MELSRVGVIGAGMMGSEIALVFALAGVEVLLSDRDRSTVDAAIEKLKGILDKGVVRGFYSNDQAEAAIKRLKAVDGLESFADREMVIEAAFENEAVKADIYRRLDAIVGAGCIIATNTSTISITTLSGSLPDERRGRFLGTHFFSPVSRMKLVEVIPSQDTDPAIVDTVCRIMTEVEKVPVRIKDVCGFAVNRMLHAFWIEATRLVEEGVATPEDLDIACKLGLGHPVGPFELMDGVTNSLTLDAQQIMYDHYGERFLPRPMLKSMVRAGYTGRKAGRGWYRYQGGKRV
jgi:3-hydroxybutyryl-CoA dehydrogenase